MEGLFSGNKIEVGKIQGWKRGESNENFPAPRFLRLAVAKRQK
jgi:hypothetical protein